MKTSRVVGYSFLAGVIIFLDRISKWYAVHNWHVSQQINQFLSFELTFNRGISWGFFHNASNCLFTTISLIIAAVTIMVVALAVQKLKAGECIVGETLIVAGSVSNIIDRLLYGGVVDFIALSYGDWMWPLFNIADMAIVLGVVIMIWEQYKS